MSWQLLLTGPVRLQHQLAVYNVLKLQGKFPMLTETNSNVTTATN